MGYRMFLIRYTTILSAKGGLETYKMETSPNEAQGPRPSRSIYIVLRDVTDSRLQDMQYVCTV